MTTRPRSIATPTALEPEALGVGTAADRDQHDIGFERLRLAARRRLDRRPSRPLAVFSTPATFWPRWKTKPCFSSMRWNCLATSRVHARQDAVEEFDDGDLGAEPAPDRAELEPDDAGADDDELVRHGVASSSAPVEETMIFSSIATPGSGATSEPVAMTMALVSTASACRRRRR